MGKTKIAWATDTWNPVTGCSKVSPGCANCYAEALSLRFGWSKKPWTPENAAENVVLHPDRLDVPLRWRKPRRVFVNSMSDLFHEEVPDEFILRVFGKMLHARQHTFQVLTKRPERMKRWIDEFFKTAIEVTKELHPEEYTGIPEDYVDYYGPNLVSRNKEFMEKWFGHIWLGVSVENQRMADERIPLLLETPAAVRFVSAEPLLGAVNLTRIGKPAFLRRNALSGMLESSARVAVMRDSRPPLDWVIVGGESGPGYRPMDLDWARSLRDQAQAAGVPFFYKQAAGARPGQDRELDGRRWEEMP